MVVCAVLNLTGGIVKTCGSGVSGHLRSGLLVTV
jgi:hypothetical protein